MSSCCRTPRVSWALAAAVLRLTANICGGGQFNSKGLLVKPGACLQGRAHHWVEMSVATNACLLWGWSLLLCGFGFGPEHCVSHLLEVCPGWVRKRDDVAGFDCRGRPQAKESRQPLHTGKGKTTASALEPSERKAALLTPWYWPSETRVGPWTWGTVRKLICVVSSFRVCYSSSRKTVHSPHELTHLRFENLCCINPQNYTVSRDGRFHIHQTPPGSSSCSYLLRSLVHILEREWMNK